MHLDHDHDETVHSHTHTHADGTTHTHTHAHAHDHENEHTHSHEDCAHTHCDACGGCEHSPKEELMALMKYMVGHNASHANELANLAKQLQEMGETAAYDQIMLAVSDLKGQPAPVHRAGVHAGPERIRSENYVPFQCL